MNKASLVLSDSQAERQVGHLEGDRSKVLQQPS
jgi:hypothetical protein